MLAIVGRTFGLTVFAQEWWIADDAVEGSLHLGWELDSFFEVIVYELLEDSETFVDFEKLDFWSALVLSGGLIELVFVAVSFQVDSPSSFSTE
jgi:hypothetical protein